MNFFTINCLIYYELIWEFHSTFSTTSLIHCTLDTTRVIKFRLLGQKFAYSLTKFNKAFRLIDDESAQSEAYMNSYMDIYNDFNPQFVHKTLTHQSPASFNPIKSSDSYLHSPALVHLHLCLHTLFQEGRIPLGILSKTELFFCSA